MVSMLDLQQTAWHLTFSAQCWLSIRLEFAGSMIVMLACLVAVMQHATKGGDEHFAGTLTCFLTRTPHSRVRTLSHYLLFAPIGLAGLSISFALAVTQTLNWTVRMASDLEANMVAVERIQEYYKIPGEAPRLTLSDESLNWPLEGKIEFVDVLSCLV